MTKRAKTGAPPEAREKIDAYGLEAVCASLMEGSTIIAISEAIGVSKGSLIAWIAAVPDRSARVREARIVAASLWDELATDRIANACDPFELAKAKELAHHYRWRASKIAPRDYGDRQQTDVTIRKAPEDMTDDELARIAASGSARAADEA